MSSHFPERRRHPRSSDRVARWTLIGIGALLVGLALGGCDREERGFHDDPPRAGTSGVIRVSTLQPGMPRDSMRQQFAYEDNTYALSEGQRLFGWYNCSGCHSHGGGGMGPALMDDAWIYGSAPENIYHTIEEGRPNGMPSFGGKIPPVQIWQLVAYVRSLSSLNSAAARSSRDDHMMALPRSTITQPRAAPKQAGPPPNERPR